MKINWDEVSTKLSTDQAESLFEPVGRFVLIHTQFDYLIGRIILALSGLTGHPMAEHIYLTIDAVNKKRILDASSSIYGSDPFAAIEDYKPQPELRRRMRSLSAAFEAASKVRNTIAHGTPARLGDRVFIGSNAAPHFFKNTGGAESWVFLDELDGHLKEMLAAIDEGQALRDDFVKAHEGIARSRKEGDAPS